MILISLGKYSYIHTPSHTHQKLFFFGVNHYSLLMVVVCVYDLYERKQKKNLHLLLSSVNLLFFVVAIIIAICNEQLICSIQHIGRQPNQYYNRNVSRTTTTKKTRNRIHTFEIYIYVFVLFGGEIFEKKTQKILKIFSNNQN